MKVGLMMAFHKGLHYAVNISDNIRCIIAKAENAGISDLNPDDSSPIRSG